MKFIHIADVHLGSRPDAGSSYSEKRAGEIWNSFRYVIDVCEEEQTDLLLIAGDLFHRQPLLRELKEADSMFSGLSRTKVVLIAGNHDHIKKESYYHTFSWSPNVSMILSRELTEVGFPELETAVYGLSYDQKELPDRLYDQPAVNYRRNSHGPRKEWKYRILLAHGGDANHIPFSREKLLAQGYDYIALGHIHKPDHRETEWSEARMAYAGALEPIDKNDTGKHGFIRGTITESGSRIQFVPCASREYIHIDIRVTPDMTGFSVRGKIKEAIEARGIRHIYRVDVIGFRDPDRMFDLTNMDTYGNIVQISDQTKLSYDFEKLVRHNGDNLLGKYIRSFEGFKADSIEYQALCEGVRALIETRRG